MAERGKSGRVRGEPNSPLGEEGFLAAIHEYGGWRSCSAPSGVASAGDVALAAGSWKRPGVSARVWWWSWRFGDGLEKRGSGRACPRDSEAGGGCRVACRRLGRRRGVAGGGTGGGGLALWWEWCYVGGMGGRSGCRGGARAPCRASGGCWQRLAAEERWRARCGEGRAAWGMAFRCGELGERGKGEKG